MGGQSQGRTHPSTAFPGVGDPPGGLGLFYTLHADPAWQQDSGPQFNDHANGIVNGGIFYEAQGSIELIVDTVTLR